MKTKISTFITIIALLFGATTAVAQGTQAYFNKNGVTVFQKPIANIDSIVFKQGIETNYVPVDWNTNVITGFDENTGAVNIQYQGTPPSFIENKVIVLPIEYGYDIRVIKSSTVSGNTVTLQTEQGNMSNLFKNTSFTLSTDPSLSSLRSSGNDRVITPSEIGIMTANGYKKIYDRSSSMRAEYDSIYNIFSFKKDFSGYDLYNKNGERVYWDKGIFNIGLKGVFSFEFGEEVVDKIHWGKLEKFEFYLDGNLNIDLLLKYVFSAQSKENKENLLKANILPRMDFTFMVGAVPVVISVYTDLHDRYDLNASAKITMSAGCNIQANARMGLTYIPNAGVSPIKDFNSSFTLYDPTFTAQGSLAAKGSIYPRITFGIYSFLGPWVEPIPYLRENFEGGMRASTDGNNYLGWTSQSYAGMDCRMGLDLDFALFNTNAWTSDIYNLKDALLFDMPKKIALALPTDGTRITSGRPVDVGFYVSSYNNITGNYFPCIGGLVNFSTQGDVNKWFAVSDVNGSVIVQWTPKNSNDRLTAKIVDKDGQTISEATFTPEYDDASDGILINGVRWATRNVGAPHTFVQNPEDYGGYYQWNKGTTDFLLYDDYDYSIYAYASSWLSANDPSPAGWRVPTLAEIQKLLDTNNVTSEWMVTLNGVNGRKFTDRATGNSIFLPEAGWRESDGGAYVGSEGYYWSSTADDDNDVYILYFNSDGAQWYPPLCFSTRREGFLVRAVAK